MRISTLSIGDELICGQIIDSNAASIAATLIRHGLRIQRHVTVGDSELDIMDALADLGHNNDAIIVTGGLGPTVDDLTTHAAARATGRRLVMNEEAREHLYKMTSRFVGRPVSQVHEKQAMIPTKTTLIPNPTGTACGFHLMHNGCFMFFMPGVPSEMAVMLRDSVIPFLIERDTKKRIIRSADLNVFGLGEPQVDELLTGIARPENGLQLGICVSFPSIRVTLRAEADSVEGVEALLAPALQVAREKLGENIFSEGEVTLHETIATMLRQQGLTLALAESCTGGMIAQHITSLAGSSRYFLEGAVTYGNSSKIARLGIPAELIAEKGAVSGEVAAAMAKGIRSGAGSDLGLAVTGVAGPDGGTDEKPVGTVFVSLAASDGCWTQRFLFGRSRSDIRIRTTWTALDWLRRYLLKRSLS
ncbi:MAG: competence/damage-inducible protein A [Desulfuromonadales bacterium]|nr:competence/damage-inducible protein A [Desulfuromonadales bacterium]